MTRVAVALVHFRTPRLVDPCVRALEADARASGLELEILLIDNGSEREDREAWRHLPLTVQSSSSNLGYASGVNAGVAASHAPLVIAMNPDVEVRPGCLGRLVAALEGGADAAGPLFTWDGPGRILLPPTETRSAADELWSALAERVPALTGRARRRWRRHARRHWEAAEELESFALSGALLAFRRESFTRIGPFDEGFRLYFEETDWLFRLRRQGGTARFVPAARAAHWYAQSSLAQAEAPRWFAQAERRFRRRWLGPGITNAIERLGARDSRRATAAANALEKAPRPAAAPALDRAALGVASGGSWIELAPESRGFPAAAERLERPGSTWELPSDVWSRPGTPCLFVRGVDAAGRESRSALYPRDPARAGTEP